MNYDVNGQNNQETNNTFQANNQGTFYVDNNQQYQNANNVSTNTNMNQPNYSNYQNNDNQNQNLSSQQNPKKNNNIVKIILIALVIIVGIIIIAKIFGGSSSGEVNVGTGKEANIKTPSKNMTVSVGDVQRGIVYTKNSNSILSMFELDGTYTKVKVNIKNNNSEEDEINVFVFPISLLDSSKNEITLCSYGEDIQDERVANEKLQDKIPANSTISGYVYCETDSNLGTILSVSVISSVSNNSEGKLIRNWDNYYFDLN